MLIPVGSEICERTSKKDPAHHPGRFMNCEFNSRPERMQGAFPWTHTDTRAHVDKTEMKCGRNFVKFISQKRFRSRILAKGWLPAKTRTVPKSQKRTPVRRPSLPTSTTKKSFFIFERRWRIQYFFSLVVEMNRNERLITLIIIELKSWRFLELHGWK